MAKNDLQGTLDLLVLKTLAQMGALHGYGIVLIVLSVSLLLLFVAGLASLVPARKALAIDPIAALRSE